MSRTYPVGIVGEASYQRAIRRCAEGEIVRIIHEPDNPYDEMALAVVSENGRTLGYIARDSWLQEAIHGEGKGCHAQIKEINSTGAGRLGIVLDVALSGVAVETRAHRSPQEDAAPRGCLAMLLTL